MHFPSLVQWIFVHLPKRFIFPLLALLAWYLFYVWPWILAVVFPSPGIPPSDIRMQLRGWLIALIPSWLYELNLTPAVQATVILLFLGVGVLLMYDLTALWYRAVRKWSSGALVIVGCLIAIAIYAFPWVWAPKDWGQPEISRDPFYYFVNWQKGWHQYGVLFVLPLLAFFLTVAIWVAKKLRRSKSAKARTYTPARNHSFGKLHKDDPALRIGIILSGGGAKGVYQAGAMRAIYEFLKEYDALHSVKMIAGTSIGAWNSLFWLTGLVDSNPNEPSVHENWWRSTNIRRILQFSTYVPLRQNYFLDNSPWRESFDSLFRDRDFSLYLDGISTPVQDLESRVAKNLIGLGIFDADQLPNNANDARTLQAPPRDKEPVHFYLTHSNVVVGRLEFSTNWGQDEKDRASEDPFFPVNSLDSLKDGVFASMDIPPLFPYYQIASTLFEDGGVVDNLPIRLGTFVEQCDLLFVLALNSDFETPADHRSMTKRLMRVINVRQGVLERNSIKQSYLYNHIAHLTQKLSEYKTNSSVEIQLPHGDVAGSSGSSPIKRKKPVKIFAICPLQPAIDTVQFWKTEEFGSAFRTMYDATRVELRQFNFGNIATAQSNNENDLLRMALVSNGGNITHNYRF